MKHLEHRTADTFDGWLTPEWVLELVRKVGPIGLDPCTEMSNPVDAQYFWAAGGTEQPWNTFGKGLVYVNPPYGRALSEWSKKIIEEAQHGREIIVLVPARTETNWYGDLFDNAAAVAFFRKRIKFWHPSQPDKNSPKFPNAMFYFGENADLFADVFNGAARVVIL